MQNQVGRANPRTEKKSPATKKVGRKPVKQVGGGQSKKYKPKSKPGNKPLKGKCSADKRNPIKRKNIKK